MDVLHLPLAQVSRRQAEDLIRLQDRIWPKPEKIALPMEQRLDRYFNEPAEAYEIFLIYHSADLVAHAEIFERTVGTNAGTFPVMALASVCTPPERRGDGYGNRIVQEAFRQVDTGRFALSLFQTGVPKFYERFGARIVTNQFVNSKAKGGTDRAPWWNPYTMVYPGTYGAWPEGEIDLRGPGY